MATAQISQRMEKATPGTRLQDPKTSAIATVVAYDQQTDALRLSDGRRASIWDRLKIVRPPNSTPTSSLEP